MSLCSIRNILLLFLVPALFACDGDLKGFKKTRSGLRYKFHEQPDTGKAVQTGDEVTVSLKLYTGDTVFLETGRDEMLSPQILIEEQVYPGDLYEALKMMKTGDSATFILHSADLFLAFFRMQDIPEYIADSADVYADIRIQTLLPHKEVKIRDSILAEQKRVEMEEARKAEPGRIAAFMKENSLQAAPRPSGLIYIETRAGKGKPIVKGHTVTLHYTARLTDGKIIETSLKEEAIKSGIFDTLFDYTPFTFVMGDGATVEGWEEGVSCMRRGGKAILIVPASLAYGEEGLEDLIPPWSPVIYEIEILDVNE